MQQQDSEYEASLRADRAKEAAKAEAARASEDAAALERALAASRASADDEAEARRASKKRKFDEAPEPAGPDAVRVRLRLPGGGAAALATLGPGALALLVRDLDA